MQRRKPFFLFEWIDDPEKLKNTQILPYETFFSKLRNNKTPEKDYSNFQVLIEGSLTLEEALSKLKVKQPSATGQESYHYLTNVSTREHVYLQKL